MSKRLKYSKLRLIKSDSNVAAPMQPAAEQQSDGNDLNTGENILRSCKKSKFFTAESCSQATFIENDDEHSDDSNKEPAVPNLRRRTQSEDVCSSDGPKLPKLRKKTLNGNGLISNFLNTQIVEDDDFEESRQNAVPQPKQTKVQRAAKKPKQPRKPKNQSDIRKIFKKYKSDYDVLHELIKDHSASEQVDPEQLQMALAMSRSLADQECSSVEGCEDNLKNQDIIAIESEDESSIVLDISAEVPILHRSTENIFDESDMEPIVSFEVYSSEEEKISSKVHQEKPISKEDTQQPNRGAIASKDHEQFDNTNPTDQPLVKSNSKCMEIAEIPQCPVVNDKVGVCAVQSNRGEKMLSFNRIAIDARLSEALETGANRVETVDLVDYTPSVDETIENNDSRHENSIVDLPKSETVINEPIDEVPVDVSHHIEEINNDEEDNLNETELYYHHEPQKEGQVRQETVIVQSQEPPCSNDDLVCVSSDEFKVVEQPSNCAESTFVYLDNLIKQFNLPPLRLQKSNTNSLKSLSRDECSKATVSSQPLEKAVDKDGHVNFFPSPFVMDGTANDLEEDTIPNLRVDDAELEVIEPDKDTQGFSSPIQYQDNLNGQKERSNVILSPTGETACSTKPACNQPKANRFEDKFSELKLMASPARCPEYLIGVKPFDFEIPSYENMSTPQIERELFKYGLKDLNRPKAVRVLNHLFEATHMLVDVQERIAEEIEKENSSTITSMHSRAKVNSISPTSRPMNHASQELSQNNPLLHPCPFKLDLGTDEVYLPLNPRKKIASVPVPLHIAFFNLVSENVALQRSILLYQPVDLDEICSVLKEVGLRYETNDIIAFLDKLCITFRSTSSGVNRVKSNCKK
ncbi:structure-specific endonuclease subunit SLX4 [Anopheles ziemanni]|uniref:structure-specific endonuclease subunit SLX4 n=1 Tax=Anopheles ziemanni TaxID=345580 RepID=UPI00265E7503|nr:structure-specific endonuclease subunit SLX4 [Anopheles ziemanni]